MSPATNLTGAGYGRAKLQPLHAAVTGQADVDAENGDRAGMHASPPKPPLKSSNGRFQFVGFAKTYCLIKIILTLHAK